ncbi:MAG: beta-3-deoxy-D-manno-oct-2-ulosonic acid transferase [Alphaproteobacteria bacterium]
MTMPRETLCVGYGPWNRRALTPFLRDGSGPVRFMVSPARALQRAERRHGRLAVRASGPYDLFIRAARDRGIPVVQVEDGFLRSVGLGREWARPVSLVLDGTGIHYDPSAPSDLERLIREGLIDDALLDRAEALIARINALGLSKYNVGGRQDGDMLRQMARGRPVILVPGQVETDASVLKGSPEIRRNTDLLVRVRRDRPDAFIVYKPHPDVERGFRPGRVPQAILDRTADLTLRDVHASSALALADEVHTMTSLMGYEALLRGLRVTAYGAPFYAGWGLTSDRVAVPRRGVPVSLARLTAATLILYPDYRHPQTGEHCSVEDVLDLLAVGTGRTGGRPGLRAWTARLIAHSFAAGRTWGRRQPGVGGAP